MGVRPSSTVKSGDAKRWCSEHEGGKLTRMLLTPNLVRWQWEAYPVAHRDRRNLLIHGLTNPVFIGSFVTAVTGAASLNPWAGVAGLGGMAVAMAAQGKGHKLEVEPPARFQSPLDVVARIFVEQLFTFPRFVLSGKFFEAWRLTKLRPPPSGGG